MLRVHLAAAGTMHLHGEQWLGFGEKRDIFCGVQTILLVSTNWKIAIFMSETKIIASEKALW